MAAGTPGRRRHLAEAKEIAGPASRWSWARTTDGRAASGNGYHRAHGGSTGDEYQLEQNSFSAISYTRQLMDSQPSS